MTEFLSVFSSVMFVIWLVCGIIGAIWPRKPQIAPRPYRDDRRPTIIINNYSDRTEQRIETEQDNQEQPMHDRWNRSNLN